MIVVLCVAVAGLVATNVAALWHLDRAAARSADERRHLTHIAITRHAGELRAVEGVAVVERDGTRTPVNIEGLN